MAENFPKFTRYEATNLRYSTNSKKDKCKKKKKKNHTQACECKTAANQ